MTSPTTMNLSSTRPRSRSPVSVGKILAWIILLLAVVFAAFPVLWMLLASFKTRSQILSPTPQVIFTPTLDNYRDVFGGARGSVIKYMMNSIIVSVVSTVLSVALAALSAYSLARLRPPGHKQFGLLILGMRMLPPIAMVVPIYFLENSLGLLDTRAGLILPYTALGIPLATWMLQGFFLDLPTELEEAAILDGASHLQAFLRVILPLAAPGLAAVSVFSFTLAWNDLVLALPLTSFDAITLPSFVSRAQTDEGVAWGYLGAVSSIITIPVLIFTLSVQRWLVGGITAGAVK